MKTRLLLFAAIIFAVSAAAAISFAQHKPDTDQPIRGDFKITIKTNMAGQDMQSTTMIKGVRERSETSMGGMNMGSVNITQCDLRRTIQVNDRSRKYLITPMESDSGDVDSGGVSAPSSGGGPTKRGGVVTMTVNTTDTGERKEMFGFTARHLKRTTMMESSPDACQQQQMKIETDGWYINLEYGLSCGGSERPPQMGRAAASPGGCRDRYQFKRTGPTKLGYPLIETTTMYGADGSAMFTRTAEVIELSRQPLDAALFDVPAGYAEAKSQQEMYSQPSMSEMQAMGRQQQGQSSSSGETSMSGRPSTANAAGRVKVGVVEFNNKAKASVSADSLRDQLIGMLNGDGVDAIALNASSPSEAAIEAKAKGCGYILYTDISSLKTASAGKKIGGLLGRATGVDSGGGKAEARFDFRLLPAGSSSPTVQSSASGKEDSQEASISAALEGEARAVAAAVPKM
ncbi:MAG TPA: hypothetical protein VHE60_15035 [Pyrinomonadaceae bacterium]|nr:hypothetical protein [Pyrinomonadaceae bacterium]